MNSNCFTDSTTLTNGSWITCNAFFLSKSVHHFVPSAKEISLNLTITQAGSSYGICLGPSLCSKIIPCTISIDPLTNTYVKK